MINWNFVTQRLAIGGEILKREDALYLKKHAITHVINLMAERDDAPLMEGLGYLWNPTFDDGKPKDAAWFKRSIDFAFPVLTTPGQRLYVHCHLGYQRAPSTAYAILRAFGLPPKLTETMIKNVRPKCGIGYKKDADRAIKELGFETQHESYP